MKEQVLKLIVDQRERNGDLLATLEGSGFEIDVKTIPVGDYVISDRICIERKTVSDFESSIINGRLFDQLERLKESYELPIMVLEGDGETFHMKQKVINGTIAAIYVDYGIPIIFSRGPENTAEIITTIAKREQMGKRREPSLKGGARAYTIGRFQEFVIGNLPGVGPRLAKSMLKHFGTVRAIANADVDGLVKVEGIGKKKAQKIHDTINELYREEEVTPPI